MKSLKKLKSSMSSFYKGQLAHLATRSGLVVSDRALSPLARESDPRIQFALNVSFLVQSNLIDLEFYSKNLSGSATEHEAAAHYLTVGALGGLNPSPWFSNDRYKRLYMLSDSENPLLHHIRRCLLNLNGGVLDEYYYLRENPDVAQSGYDPAWHFLTFGASEGRRPSARFSAVEALNVVGWRAGWDRPALESIKNNPHNFEVIYNYISESFAFDSNYYNEQYADIKQSGLDPLMHYIENGHKEGRNPSAYFDNEWYKRNYPDVVRGEYNPLAHYLAYGFVYGYNPKPDFVTDWYLTEYLDVMKSGINPLVHYQNYGYAEGRKCKPEPVAEELVGPVSDRYAKWIELNRLSARDIRELTLELEVKKDRLPKISLITPVYNTDPVLLDELIESVLAQIHPDWELVLVDDASPAPYVAGMLEKIASRDSRIKTTRLQKNHGISGATNAGVEFATGSIIAFLDHDDLITPDCVAELALYYADHPEVDIVYSDDDKIDMNGARYAPQFKPGWSPTLLLSYMYIGHIFSVKKKLYSELGGFRSEFDGSQDYDFALRASEVAVSIGHIPKILYHWRAAPGSTASSADTKPASLEAGRRAVEEALIRRGVQGARAVHPRWAEEARVGIFEVEFPDEGPEVCLVIPTKNQLHYIKACVDSLTLTKYRNYKVLVVDNYSDDPETIKYLRGLDCNEKIKVVRIRSPKSGFSYSNLNNLAVKKHVTSEYVCFLNNDTKVISQNWLSQMMGYIQLENVGVVGARLYFEDGTIQHAGIVHGYHEGLVGHAFRGLAPHDWGYQGYVRVSREYSGVTAACMVTKRDLFLNLGGFDETNFAVAYNDVDYCYKVVGSGNNCVYCAQAELFHFEGKTRGFKDNPAERVNFRRIYGDWTDRWYNPNLSLENERFEIDARRPQARNKGALKVVAVTHNLNNEGAPTTLMDLLIGLKEQGAISPVVLSPSDGPLRSIYEKNGIAVEILDFTLYGVVDRNSMLASLGGVASLLKIIRADVVIANTLQTYWAIKAAHLAQIPTIWCQHESESWKTYFDFLPQDARQIAYSAFSHAYRVLYVAEATRSSWREIETAHNFKVIRHGIPAQRLSAEVSRWSKGAARKALGVKEDEIVFVVIGTVCRRKGQKDLVEAVINLANDLSKNIKVFIAGKLAENQYVSEILDLLANAQSKYRGQIILTDHIEDPFLYYSAADVFVCTSIVESAPRVIVEAMACSLPIITTPVFGIPELVRPGVNAWFYEPGDITTLSAVIRRFVESPTLRSEMASNSPKVLSGLPGFREMVDGYKRVIQEAVNLAK